MRFRGFFTIFLCSLCTASLAQTAIQGHVFDSESNKPLANAYVYIANSTKGSTTNSAGEFKISNLAPGHYRLIVSFMGYTTLVIEVSTTSSLSYKIMLKPALKELDEVVFRSKQLTRSQWAAYFAIFKEHFIGLSDNYKLCSFENPRDLDFYKEGFVFKATSDTILVINNLGLGYKIRLFLDKYEYNEILTRTHYEGQFAFEPLEPSNKEEAMTWAKARLKAYYGSEMQFLRSLYNRDLNNDGYYFALIKNVNLGTNGGFQRVGWADTTVSTRAAIYNYKRYKVSTVTNYNKLLDSLRSTPEEPILNFTGDLQIQYVHEAEGFNYQSNRYRPYGKNPQTSHMKLLKPAVIQQNGVLYPADAVETSGYWSWELVAEALPLDYDPEDDIKLTGFRILTQEELAKGH